jgi:hypothetical protein
VLSVILANPATPATLAHVTQSKALRGLGGGRRKRSARDLSAAAFQGHGRSQQRKPEVPETRVERRGGQGPGAEREREIVVEAATLVVCPNSVLTVWEAQAKKHTMPGAVRVTILTSRAGTSPLVSAGWGAGLGGGGGRGGIGAGGGAEQGVAGNVGRGERRKEEEGVVKLEGGRQEVVLVSYERLRSMHRKFLVLQKAIEAVGQGTSGGGGGGGVSGEGGEVCALPAATCNADGHAEDSEECREEGAQEIVGGTEGSSVLGDTEAGEAGDGESWCGRVGGGGPGGGRGFEKRGSLSVVGGAKRGAGGKAKGVEAERKKEETLRAMFTGQWWRVVLDEAHVIKNRHSLSNSWRLLMFYPCVTCGFLMLD